MTDTAPATPTPDTTPPAPADPATIAARDAELTEMASTNAPAYYYEDGGKLACEHLAIRQAQQAAGKADQQPTEQPEDGEIADADADVADIDLDAESDDAGEGEEVEQTEERAPLKAWEPPKGMTVAEFAKPVIAELDTIASNEEQRDQIIGLQQKLVEAQMVRLAEINKAAKAEMVASLKEELGANYAEFRCGVDDNFKSLPKELQTALRSARLPDGRLLITMPEMIRTIGGLNNSQSGQHVPQPPQGSQAAMQEELRQLDELMTSDIDAYRRPNWRGLGVSASERRLEIMRELGNEGPRKPSAADIETEKRELLRLRTADPDLYRFGDWRGTGRPAADRLHALQMGRG